MRDDTPLKILGELVDVFYEAEHRLELVFGMTPINPSVSQATELPYFEDEVNEDIYHNFQLIYNDLVRLMDEVEEETKR